jgi:catalase
MPSANRVLLRAFEYGRNVDKSIGDRIEAAVRAKAGEKDPKSKQDKPPRAAARKKA